jgi:hypothetical protein
MCVLSSRTHDVGDASDDGWSTQAEGVFSPLNGVGAAARRAGTECSGPWPRGCKYSPHFKGDLVDLPAKASLRSDADTQSDRRLIVDADVSGLVR